MLDRPIGTDTVAGLRFEMGTLMNTKVSVYRDEPTMREAEAGIKQLKQRYAKVGVRNKGRVFNTALIFALELGTMLDCAETIVAAAIDRKESRGAHTRKDCPTRDDENWLRHVVTYHTPDGPRIDYLPVTITKWPPQERKY